MDTLLKRRRLERISCMKKIERMSILFLILIAMSHPVNGELTLNPGDTFDYKFTSVPFSQYESVRMAQPRGSFSLFARPESLQPGDVLTYQMFENSGDPVSICSGILPLDGMATCQINGAWRDFEGEVRFTMQNGSVTLERLSIDVFTLAPVVVIDIETHSQSTVVLVPEAGIPSLLTAGILAIGWRLRTWRPHKAG